ncbi:MAG: 6-bladed beta-propeller [Calditrichaeota bacterium]|nr:MAG: 6-bladed beta-propeller [Calditrichota bacterium]
MNKFSRYIFFIFTLSLAFSCKKTALDLQVERIKNANSFSEIFQQEKSIVMQFPRSTEIEDIVDALLLPSRQFCVLTSGDKAGAYLFDVGGKFIKQLRPADKFIKNFGQPWQVELDSENNFHIFDLRRHKIFVFNLAGKYLHMLDAPKGASSFRISSANQYYFNLPVSTDGTTILVTQRNGNASRSFSLMPPIVQEILHYKTIVPKRPLLTFDQNGEIFQAFPIENTIYKFGTDFHFKGSFEKKLQRYHAPDIVAWRAAVKQPGKNRDINNLLSHMTLFSGLHNPAHNIIMAEFLNIADRQPRYLVFYTSAGAFLNGDIVFDKDNNGKILRADKERLFTCRTDNTGRTSKFILNVYFIPRR